MGRVRPASRSAASRPRGRRAGRRARRLGAGHDPLARARRGAARPSRRERIAARAAAPGRAVRRVRQRAARRGRRSSATTLGLTMLQLHGDEGPAFCAEVARRTGAQVIKAARVAGPGDVQRARALPHVDFHLLDAHRRATLRGGTGRDLRLGARRGAPLAGAADPLRRPDADNVGERDRRGAAVRGRRRQRHRVRARAQGPGEAARAFARRRSRAPPSWPAAATPAGRRPRRSGERRARRRAPLRPLRRPVRPRDADAGARRARAGVARGARRPRLPRRARRRCCATTPAGRRRSTAPSGCREVAGRAGLAQARGPDPHRRAQDQQRARPGAARQAHGQAADHRRDRAPGQHGVATATACALLGLECVVYMGAEDMRRQQPNVQRMELLGATVRAGRGRRADAQGGDLGGDPRLGHERRDARTT